MIAATMPSLAAAVAGGAVLAALIGVAVAFVAYAVTESDWSFVYGLVATVVAILVTALIYHAAWVDYSRTVVR